MRTRRICGNRRNRYPHSVPPCPIGIPKDSAAKTTDVFTAQLDNLVLRALRPLVSVQALSKNRTFRRSSSIPLCTTVALQQADVERQKSVPQTHAATIPASSYLQLWLLSRVSRPDVRPLFGQLTKEIPANGIQRSVGCRRSISPFCRSRIQIARRRRISWGLLVFSAISDGTKS